jgi:hypothetical protein
MRLPILHAGYQQIAFSLATWHDQLCPPVPVAPKMFGVVEGPVPLGWPPGFLSHKKASRVMVDGHPGIQQGHDMGYFILHFALPMNALCGVNTMLSKHKVMVPISRVLLERSPAGTYLYIFLGLICCNPYSRPTGICMWNAKCTVHAGADLLDIVKALGYIALDIAFDLFWNKLFKGTWSGKKKGGFKLKVNLSRFQDNAEATRILETFSNWRPRAGLIALLRARGAGLVTRYMLPQLGNKVIDHVAKSWAIGPLATGLPRGQAKIGKGDILSHKFFDAKWW